MRRRDGLAVKSCYIFGSFFFPLKVCLIHSGLDAERQQPVKFSDGRLPMNLPHQSASGATTNFWRQLLKAICATYQIWTLYNSKEEVALAQQRQQAAAPLFTVFPWR